MAKKKISNYTGAPYLNFEYDDVANTLTIWNVDGNKTIVYLGGGTPGPGYTFDAPLTVDSNNEVKLLTGTEFQLNPDNKLVLKIGQALDKDSNGYLKVRFDGSTIGLNSSGDLTVLNTPTTGGNANFSNPASNWTLDNKDANVTMIQNQFNGSEYKFMYYTGAGNYTTIIDTFWDTTSSTSGRWEFSSQEGANKKLIGADDAGLYYYTAKDQVNKNYLGGIGTGLDNIKVNGKAGTVANKISSVEIDAADIKMNNNPNLTIQQRIDLDLVNEDAKLLQLKNEIDDLAQKSGFYLGKYEQSSSGFPDTLILDRQFPNANINDFITVTDNTHSAYWRYVCSANSGGTIEFTKDIQYSQDVTGKVDKPTTQSTILQGYRSDTDLWYEMDAKVILMDVGTPSYGSIYDNMLDLSTSMANGFQQVNLNGGRLDLIKDSNGDLAFKNWNNQTRTVTLPVKDVKVGSTSVVDTNGVANINVPTVFTRLGRYDDTNFTLIIEESSDFYDCYLKVKSTQSWGSFTSFNTGINCNLGNDVYFLDKSSSSSNNQLLDIFTDSATGKIFIGICTTNCYIQTGSFYTRVRKGWN